jgi:hypothetical protein
VPHKHRVLRKVTFGARSSFSIARSTFRGGFGRRRCVPSEHRPEALFTLTNCIHQWAPDLPLNDTALGGGNPRTWAANLDPGGSAATRIRNEVVKYMLDHTDVAPLTAKIITRVFVNYGYERSRHVKYNGATRGRTVAHDERLHRAYADAGTGITEFALQFTEKMALFDMFDSGRGKERADDKIRGRTVPARTGHRRHSLLTVSLKYSQSTSTCFYLRQIAVSYLWQHVETTALHAC